MKLLATLLLALSAAAQPIHITTKPSTLVHGELSVPITTTTPVTRVELLINGVHFSEAVGQNPTFRVHIGEYIRRLRIRAVGYDASGAPAGEDEMVVNDPRPPFRVRMQALNGTLSANVIHPDDVRVAGVDFYVGETKIGTAASEPYTVAYDAAKFPNAVYARVVARGSNGDEANDVTFFGERPLNQINDQIDVTVQQIPMSVASGTTPLRLEDVTLLDNGEPRKIEALTPASDQPLNVILLIDYSESMLDELPVVKEAARGFAQALLRPQDRIAIVGFNQRLFWLTGFTNDWKAAAEAVDRVKPIGETHLYDSAIEMLFELQKTQGRHALVVLTDGVDQGSTFNLDHLVHYARYAGVPVYPIVKNKMLSRLMRFGIGQLEARRLASIARDTGATYFIIKSERELPSVYARLAQELRQQYQLSFYSPPAAADSWHMLKVESKGGQSLRIPKGYFP
ncbi:MAG TPA: VWA domain-containing protein [Thermoanaerobaculia bacterium]|nr:VWA domain-containing protein [Thermoanaerobaculia bacterium]